MKRTFVFLVVVLLASGGEGYGAKPPKRLGVRVDGDRIEVQRAETGGAVLVVGYERRTLAGAPHFRRVEAEIVAGADGTAWLQLPEPAAANSFWLAIDLTSGAYGAERADKQELRERELGKEHFQLEPDGRLKKLVAKLDYVHVVVVRPGVGVWSGTAGEGGASDEDGALNGDLVFSADRFQRGKNTSTDAGEFQEGDIVAVLVPHQMGYLLTEVKK